MNENHIKKIDYNLLVILDAVVREGNLTRAGARLGLSQSAISHALNRLRRLTRDDLFKRGQRGVEPTHLAREIASDVRIALERVNTALNPSPSFDPATAEQVFMIDVPPGVDSILVPRLAARLRNWPGLSLRVFGGRARSVLDALRHGDSWLALDDGETQEPGFKNQLLSVDPMVVVARRDHPRLRNAVTLPAYKQLDHIGLAWSREAVRHPVELRLEQLRVARRMRMTVTALSTLFELIEASDMVATLTERTAGAFASKYAVTVHPLRFSLPPLRLHMVWHASFNNNPGHAWLRSQIEEVFAG